MRDQSDAAAASRQMQAAVLRSIKSDLDLLIAPQLVDREASTAATLASEMLAYLVAAGTTLPALADQSDETLQALCARTGQLLEQAGETEGDQPQPAVASELYSSAGFSATSAQLAQGLARLLASDVKDSGAVAALAADAVSAERLRLQRELELVKQEMSAAGDPVAAVEKEITPALMQAFFDARLPDAGKVEQVERIPGGYSKDTWRLQLSAGIQGHSSLILRRDLPFGPGENTVTEEYQLLCFLHDAGLSVPKPLWAEADPGHVGRPFLLFPLLPGTAVFGEWVEDSVRQRAIIVQVAQLMARLHTLDPLSSGLLDAGAADRSPQDLVRDYILGWREKWLRRRSHPSLIMEVAFDWLLHNVPTNLAHPSFVHGDISFRNTLIDQHRLVALLDWEFWHLGDPMEDLSYFRLVAEPHIDWQDVMQAYQAAGGCAYDEDREAYYAVWRSVRNGTTTTTAWYGFLNGLYPASKSAYQGVSLYRFFLRDVAEQLGKVLT